MDDLVTLYGTAEPPQPARRLQAGPLSVDLVNGNLRTIRFGGREVLRGIAYVVRDRDWGTYDPSVEHLAVEETAERFALRYEATCRAPDGATLRLQAEIAGTMAGDLAFTVEAVPDAAFETNRCGFCVLHPIEGVAGTPVEILHVDGSLKQSRLPDLIEPWQPFRDMRAITHEVAPGLRATCRLEGDTFEMEDQRAWTDASYKTYVRPLSQPWPYRMPAGERNRQSVTLRLQGSAPAPAQAGGSGPVTIAVGEATDETMPRFGVAVAPEETTETLRHPDDLARLAPRFLLFPFDPGTGHGAEALRDFARVADVVPAAERVLEVAVPTAQGDLDAVFAALRDAVEAAGLRPDALVVGPDVDRQSTPPGSRWPDCPPLEEVYAAARRGFPHVALGGGMLSYFTELNRKRVPVRDLDFVTHATCPIVHAADDLSVMQTLEAIPFVTRSTRAFIGAKPYRLGPTTIGMRQNPYGSRTMPNPDDRRIAMASDDPRARGRFGAAFLVGYAARLACGSVDSWCGANFAGPRGLFRRDARPAPTFAVAEALAAASNGTRLDLTSGDRASIDGFALRRPGGAPEVWLANLTAQPQKVRLMGGATAWSAVDTGDTGTPPVHVAEGEALSLSPYAVVRLQSLTAADQAL